MKLRQTEMIFTMPELVFMARTDGCDLAQIWDRDVGDIRTTLALFIDEHDGEDRLPSRLLASTLIDRFNEHMEQPEFPGDRQSMGGDQVMLDTYLEK